LSIPISKQQQAEVLAAAEKATPGPWIATTAYYNLRAGTIAGPELIEDESGMTNYADANFCALARTAIPGYAALVAQQARQLEIAKQMILQNCHADEARKALAAIAKEGK
jgi:hypothetical protein